MASQRGESSDDSDYLFDEDLEALKRACILTNTNPNGLTTSFGIVFNANFEGTNNLDLASLPPFILEFQFKKYTLVSNFL